MRFLQEAAVVGIAQDARDECLLIMVRMVCWRWPRGVLVFKASGVNSVLDGSGPPWVVERALAAARLEGDRNANATAAHTLAALRSACSSSDTFDEVRQKTYFSRQTMPQMR